MKIKEILTIVAISSLGLCLICSLVGMTMKKGKKNVRKASGVFIIMSVILIVVSQLLIEPEKYDTTAAVDPSKFNLSVCGYDKGDGKDNILRYYDSSKSADENYKWCVKNNLPKTVCGIMDKMKVDTGLGFDTTLGCEPDENKNPNHLWTTGLPFPGGKFIRCDNNITKNSDTSKKTGATGGGLLIAGADREISFMGMGVNVTDIVNEQVNSFCDEIKEDRWKNKPTWATPACTLPESPPLGDNCEPLGCGYETTDALCDTRAGKPAEDHCSKCKYGWRMSGLNTNCCTMEQRDDSSFNCIMTCSDSSCTNTKNGDNSSFPDDACPDKNRGVLCNIDGGSSPSCTFCDLGYKRVGFNDWCCTKDDTNCIKGCVNKCTGDRCPYISDHDAIPGQCGCADGYCVCNGNCETKAVNGVCKCPFPIIDQSAK